eukprot:SAG11_NODE_263_length_11526_cov_23.830314_12_plen_43_part_00
MMSLIMNNYKNIYRAPRGPSPGRISIDAHDAETSRHVLDQHT